MEEDNDNNKKLGGDMRSTRLLLGVDCELQLPPLVDGGGRDAARTYIINWLCPVWQHLTTPPSSWPQC